MAISALPLEIAISGSFLLGRLLLL